MENFITNVNDLLDYSWSDEQTNWEEETEKTYPDNKPQDEDNHIFNAMSKSEEFLMKEVGISSGKKTNVFNVLNKLTDEELYEQVTRIADELVQKGIL